MGHICLEFLGLAIQSWFICKVVVTKFDTNLQSLPFIMSEWLTIMLLISVPRGDQGILRLIGEVLNMLV